MPDRKIEALKPPARTTMRRLRAALRRAIGLTARDLVRRRRKRTSLHVAAVADHSLALHWHRIIGAMLKFGGASSGNRVKLLCDGDGMMEDLWQAIDGARNQIWFEMYIFEPDKVGRRTLDGLLRAAQRGCQVNLLVDAVGSSALTESILRPLRQAGAAIELFNPVWRWRRRGPLLRRDHRKIIIIDGQIGYTGGMNISEDYAGPRHGNCRFYDCHMRLEGPCLRHLATVFAASWRMAAHESLALPNRAEPVGRTFLQVQASSGRTGRRAIQRSLRLTIRHALKHCHITMSYFVPPPRLIRAINRAADHGVDVRILTAGVSDVPVVALAARHIYGQLLKHGVRIYEMFDSTLHAKTIAIDGIYTTVGSFNLDPWSDKRNLEVNVAIVDQAVAAEVEARFQSDIARASEITLDNWTKRPWWTRVVHWAAYQALKL
jgi:cardiolipin synthase